MGYLIIGDSCCDFTESQLKSGNYVSVPMAIIIGGVEYPDDGTRTQEDWISLIKTMRVIPARPALRPMPFTERLMQTGIIMSLRSLQN